MGGIIENFWRDLELSKKIEPRVTLPISPSRQPVPATGYPCAPRRNQGSWSIFLREPPVPPDRMTRYQDRTDLSGLMNSMYHGR